MRAFVILFLSCLVAGAQSVPVKFNQLPSTNNAAGSNLLAIWTGPHTNGLKSIRVDRLLISAGVSNAIHRILTNDSVVGSLLTAIQFSYGVTGYVNGTTGVLGVAVSGGAPGSGVDGSANSNLTYVVGAANSNLSYAIGAAATNYASGASNSLYGTETTRNAAVSNSVITEIITSSNNLRTIETTRNAAVSNSVITEIITASNNLYTTETTRNAAVSNGVLTVVNAADVAITNALAGKQNGQTNANQFGASTTLTLKDGIELTNAQVRTSLRSHGKFTNDGPAHLLSSLTVSGHQTNAGSIYGVNLGATGQPFSEGWFTDIFIDDDDSAFTLRLKNPDALIEDTFWQWPNSNAVAGQLLTSGGAAGHLYWTTPASGGGNFSTNSGGASKFESLMTVSNGNALTIAQFDGETNTYAQVKVKNWNTGNAASSDFVAEADNGGEGTNYIDFGINGSGGGGAPFTTANDAYLYSYGAGSLHIGSLRSNTVTKLYAGTENGATPNPIVTLTGRGLGTEGQVIISSTNYSGQTNVPMMVFSNGIAAPTNTVQEAGMEFDGSAYSTGAGGGVFRPRVGMRWVPTIAAAGTHGGTMVWYSRTNVSGQQTTNMTLTSAGALFAAAVSSSGGFSAIGPAASSGLTFSSGVSLLSPVNGAVRLNNAAGTDFNGIFLSGAGATNGLIQFQSSSTGNSNGTIRLMSGNTNVHLNLEAHDIGTFRTNWTADATSFPGFTNTTRYTQIWNVRGTSGNIVFWMRGDLDGGTACKTAIWTNTIIASGSDITVGVNCGIAIDTGVGVVGGGRAF